LRALLGIPRRARAVSKYVWVSNSIYRTGDAMWSTLSITVAVVFGCFVVAGYVIQRDWKAYCRLKEARRRRLHSMSAAGNQAGSPAPATPLKEDRLR